MARRVSAAPQSGTSAITSSVAGLSTANVAPESLASQLPSIKQVLGAPAEEDLEGASMVTLYRLRRPTRHRDPWFEEVPISALLAPLCSRAAGAATLSTWPKQSSIPKNSAASHMTSRS